MEGRLALASPLPLAGQKEAHEDTSTHLLIHTHLQHTEHSYKFTLRTRFGSRAHVPMHRLIHTRAHTQFHTFPHRFKHTLNSPCTCLFVSSYEHICSSAHHDTLCVLSRGT